MEYFGLFGSSRMEPEVQFISAVMYINKFCETVPVFRGSGTVCRRVPVKDVRYIDITYINTGIKAVSASIFFALIR